MALEHDKWRFLRGEYGCFGLKPWTSTLQHLALDIRPSAFINFIKAKAGEGSSVASSPEIGLLEPEHRGAGT